MKGRGKGGDLNLARDILLAVALVGGAVVLLAVAPGLGILLKPFAKKYRPRSLETAQLKRRVRQLRQEGLVATSEQGGKTKLCLTKAGQQKVLEYQLDGMTIPRQNPWDGKYRFVIFDIPETKKVAREVFRNKLSELSFHRIQDSVWYHRYPCAKEVEFIAHLYRIERNVSLIEGRVVA